MTKHVHKWKKYTYSFRCGGCSAILGWTQVSARLNEYETLEQLNADTLEALERHVKMFDMVCNKVDFGSAFLDAKTITEWNEASIQATEAIRKAKSHADTLKGVDDE